MESRWVALATLAITAIALVVAIAVPYLQRDTSELTITVLSKASLNPIVPDGFRPKIGLSINGSSVKSPHYSVVEIANSGSMPILAASVEEAINIKVKNGSVISADVISADPEALKPKASLQDGAIEVAPLLLNAGDSFQLGIISSGENPSFSASGRIAGLQRIGVTERSSVSAADRPVLRYLLAAALVIAYGAFSAVGLHGTILKRPGQMAVIHPLASLALSVAIAVSSIILVKSTVADFLLDYPKWLVMAVIFVTLFVAQFIGQFWVVKVKRGIGY